MMDVWVTRVNLLGFRIIVAASCLNCSPCHYYHLGEVGLAGEGLTV